MYCMFNNRLNDNGILPVIRLYEILSNTSRGRFPIVLGNDPVMIFSPILNVLSVWISAIVDGIVSILRERES